MSIHASENADIDLVIRNYVVGMVSADESLLRQAFHPACRIIGHYHGDLEWLSLDDFVAAIKAEGPAPSDTKPFWKIQSVDVPATRPPSKSSMTTWACASPTTCHCCRSTVAGSSSTSCTSTNLD